MSYTCPACGEQATLTACEHCGGQGRSQSAIAENARLRAELDTVKNERDGCRSNGANSREALLDSLVKARDHESALIRQRDEALANLAARDTAIAELRAAIDNMLSVMARRGRLDDGDWSKPINQLRAALAKGAPRHE